MRIYNIQNFYSQTNFSAKKGNKKHNTQNSEYGFGTQSDLAIVVAKMLNADVSDSKSSGESIAKFIPTAVVMIDEKPLSESQKGSLLPKTNSNRSNV